MHVPYKGSAQALTDLLAGQVQFMVATVATSLPHIKSGRMRALATTALKRSDVLPDVPTVSEAGLAGYEVIVWQGIVAPAGTPALVIAKLHGEIVTSLRTTVMKERLAAQGLEAVGNTPEKFVAFIKSETEKWGKVVTASGAKPE